MVLFREAVKHLGGGWSRSLGLTLRFIGQLCSRSPFMSWSADMWTSRLCSSSQPGATPATMHPCHDGLESLMTGTVNPSFPHVASGVVSVITNNNSNQCRSRTRKFSNWTIYLYYNNLFINRQQRRDKLYQKAKFCIALNAIQCEISWFTSGMNQG